MSKQAWLNTSWGQCLTRWLLLPPWLGILTLLAVCSFISPSHSNAQTTLVGTDLVQTLSNKTFDNTNTNCADALSQGIAVITCPPWNAVTTPGVDQRAAIQAALNAYSNVWCPPGTFSLLTQITLNAHQRLRGTCTLQGISTHVGTLVVAALVDDTLIEGITLDGNASQATRTTGSISSGATSIPVKSTSTFPGSGTAYLNTSAFSYTSVDATHFLGVTGVGTTFASATPVSNMIAGNPLDYQGATNFIIQRVHCINAYGTCLLIEPSGGTQSQNGRILNNWVENARFNSGITVNGGTSNCSDMLIQGNKIHNVDQQNILSSACDNVQVVDNNIQDDAGTGIQTDGADGGEGIKVSNGSIRAFLSHNQIRGAHSGATSVSGSIFTQIVENQIEGANLYGILLETSAGSPFPLNRTDIYCLVSHNTIHNPNTAGIGSIAGIEADRANVCKITDNIIYDDRTPKLMVYGIAFITGSDHDSLVNNFIAGALTSPIFGPNADAYTLGTFTPQLMIDADAPPGVPRYTAPFYFTSDMNDTHQINMVIHPSFTGTNTSNVNKDFINIIAGSDSPIPVGTKGSYGGYVLNYTSAQVSADGITSAVGLCGFCTTDTMTADYALNPFLTEVHFNGTVLGNLKGFQASIIRSPASAPTLSNESAIQGFNATAQLTGANVDATVPSGYGYVSQGAWDRFYYAQFSTQGGVAPNYIPKAGLLVDNATSPAKAIAAGFKIGTGTFTDGIDMNGTDMNNAMSTTYKAVTFSNLTVTIPQTNGTVTYCSNCTIANPCAGGGTGAVAKFLNSVWVCN